MWLSPKWFCFLFIYFVLYHGPEASKVQIKLTYLLIVRGAARPQTWGGGGLIYRLCQFTPNNIPKADPEPPPHPQILHGSATE